MMLLIKLMFFATIVTAFSLFLIISFSPMYSDKYNHFKLNLLHIGEPSEVSRKILWRPNATESAPDDRIVAQLKWIRKFASSERMKSNSEVKQILVFDAEESYYQTQQKIICPGFQFNHCNLTLSTRGNNTKKSLEKYDAIVYTQNWSKRPELLLPAHSKQLIYILESPFIAGANLALNNALLASYNRRSDITVPYSKWIQFEPGSLQSQSNLLSLRNYAEGKTGLVLIFVSNCEDSNGRLRYVRELQKYISVHVFGKCGDMRNESNLNPMQTIIQKHKFYLAFENSNCRDYITEKFYKNALMYDIVPVVLGAHPDDYKALAPLNSYIHAEDFESPRALANHLHSLNENDNLYNEYFRWKGTGFFYNALGDFFCRACGMLFYADLVPPPTWPTGATWNSIGNCLPKQQWYWTEKRRKQSSTD